jgi:hypothetical protein
MKALFFASISFTGLALAEPTVEVWSYTAQSLFPSAIVATATVDWNGDEQTAEDKKTSDDRKLRKNDPVAVYGDENGWLAAAFTGAEAKSRVSVEFSIEGFMKPSRWEGQLTKVAETVNVYPKANWDYEALLKVREERPVNLVMKISINGKALPDHTETCVMKSVNDCPFYNLWDGEEEDEQEVEDFSFMFAAYVNENHPWIGGLLKEALETDIVDSFDGYQSEDPEKVHDQVFAIWHVLQRRGIRYSDISTTTPEDMVVSQTVRFLDESIESKQANCVDGSVLMASVLKKIGLEPFLVMVPGHCFLAYMDGEGDDAELVGLETTMLGNDKLKALKDVPNLAPAALKKEYAKSAKTFRSAIKAGNESLEEHADAFDSGDDPDIQLISISDARADGIRPLPSGLAKRN